MGSEGSFRLSPGSAVDETGVTFTENATLKALSASRCIPGVLLADDSGLEVDVLDGRPGVWSSSFGGRKGTMRGITSA